MQWCRYHLQSSCSLWLGILFLAKVCVFIPILYTLCATESREFHLNDVPDWRHVPRIRDFTSYLYIALHYDSQRCELKGTKKRNRDVGRDLCRGICLEWGESITVISIASDSPLTCWFSWVQAWCSLLHGDKKLLYCFRQDRSPHLSFFHNDFFVFTRSNGKIWRSKVFNSRCSRGYKFQKNVMDVPIIM